VLSGGLSVRARREGDPAGVRLARPADGQRGVAPQRFGRLRGADADQHRAPEGGAGGKERDRRVRLPGKSFFAGELAEAAADRSIHGGGGGAEGARLGNGEREELAGRVLGRGGAEGEAHRGTSKGAAAGPTAGWRAAWRAPQSIVAGRRIPLCVDRRAART